MWLLMNLKIPFCVNKIPPLAATLNQLNPPNFYMSCLCKIYFNMTLVLACEVFSNTSLEAFVWHLYKLLP
jgi:hypothetical protein